MQVPTRSLSKMASVCCLLEHCNSLSLSLSLSSDDGVVSRKNLLPACDTFKLHSSAERKGTTSSQTELQLSSSSFFTQ